MIKPASVLLAASAALLLATGCGAGEKSVNTNPQNATPTQAETGQATQPEPADDTTSTVGGVYAEASDGVKFRVKELGRGKVGPYAAGGTPGDPAVIVTVQIKNGGTKRLDLTEVSVIVRLGADGREAEQVFDEGFSGTPDGTLSPGRTSTHKYMFAAESAAELQDVQVELSPGWEYPSVTFEGKA